VLRLPLALAGLLLLTACSADGGASGSLDRTDETITVRTSEGTTLAFDLSPDGQQLVFDLLGQLWLMPSGGGTAHPVTDAVRDTAEDLDPAFAPDGRRIAFHGERHGRTGIWLLDLDSTAPRQLTQIPNPDGIEGGPAWSPDGRRIAFARALPPDSAGGAWRSEIVLLDPGTTDEHALPLGGRRFARVRDPAWMSGGSRIGFVVPAERGAPGGRVWMVDSAGGTARSLTADAVVASAPSFSPDGRHLAFFAPDSAGLPQVWVQRLSHDGVGLGSPVRVTAHEDVTPTRIRWSADGGTLLYSADGRLWRVSPDGGPPVEIPFTAELSFHRPRYTPPAVRFAEPGVKRPARGFMGLALSPDGRTVATLALGRLWVAPVRAAPRAMTEVPMNARHLAWSPDGAELVWSAGREGEEDLFATSLAGETTRQVTALPGSEINPQYSPDGRHLAFVHQRDEAQLRVVDLPALPVGDTTRLRNLGPLGGDATSPPQWSPESDALLVPGGVGLKTRGKATVIPLSGERRTVAHFPDAPLFLQWVPGRLLYVRHDRLWRIPFDGHAPGGAPEAIGDDPALYASAARDGALLYVSAGGLKLRAPDGKVRQLGWPLSFTVPPADPLLVRNIRIIDGTGDSATAPRDLQIERGRITRIAPAGALSPGKGAMLDAEGRWAIPGLMDLHAHIYQPDLLPGYPYFGVTTVRDQGSSMAPLVAYAEAISAGVLPGPRVGYGGFQFYSDWAFDDEQGRGIEPEADAGHVARAVALAEAFGAQHVKTRTFRRWDINARMIEEAHRSGMRATGHCAHQLPLVAAGMDAKEHFGSCASRGDTRMYDDLLQLFRAAGIGVVPTVSYFSFAVRINEQPSFLRDDADLAPFVPSQDAFGWMIHLPPAGREEFRRWARQAREGAVALARAGITIGTGSDIWQVPTGAHMELEELVAAGLSPAEAIRAGTAGAARILGAEEDLGTIAVGKRADLVILDADPLADIRNTRRIWRVVLDGREVDRTGIRRRFEQLNSP